MSQDSWEKPFGLKSQMRVGGWGGGEGEKRERIC